MSGLMRNGQASRHLEAAAKRRKAKPSPISDEATDPGHRGEPTQTHWDSAKSPKTVEQSWHPEEREHHRQERAYWWWTGLLTTVAAFGAVASVILSQCSLQEARKATGEAHIQAVEAKRQADVAEKAFIENDRPIFTISYPEVDIIGANNSANPTLRVQADNIGNKPGFIVSFKGQFFLGKTPPKAMLNDDCNWNIGVKPVAVGSNLWVRCRGQTLSFSQANQVSAAVSSIYFIGIINYKSASGVEWVQHFCSYWFAGAENNPARMEGVNDPSLNFDYQLPRKSDEQ